MKKKIVFSFIVSLAIIATTYIASNADTSVVGDSGFHREPSIIRQSFPSDKAIFSNISATSYKGIAAPSYSNVTTAGGWSHKSGIIKQTIPTDRVAFGNFSSDMIISGKDIISKEEINLNIKGATSNYQSVITSTPGILSYWKFDNTYDDSITTNHGTNNGASFGTYLPPTISGASAIFAGGTQRVNLPVSILNSQITGKPFAFEFLFNATAGDGRLLSWYKDNNNRGYVYFAQSGAYYYFGVSTVAGGVGYSKTSAINKALSTNYHVVFSFDTDQTRLYINGSEDTTVMGVDASPLRYTGHTYFAVGVDYWDNAPNQGTSGRIDELAVYTTSISEATASAHAHVAGRTHIHIDNSTTTNVDLHISGDVYGGTANQIVMMPSIADGTSAIAYILDTENALGTAGAKLLSIKNMGTEKSHIDKDGRLLSPEIIGSTATTGDLRLSSTSHATKGDINFGLSKYDELLDLMQLSNLTASRVVVSDASKNLISSSVTSTQLGYVDATSSIQTQLNSKASYGFVNISGVTSYTASGLDYMYACHASVGNVTIKVRSGNAVPGRKISFKKTDNTINKCFLNATTTNTIDGFTSYSGLDTSKEAITVGSKGTGGWWIFGSY